MFQVKHQFSGLDYYNYPPRWIKCLKLNSDSQTPLTNLFMKVNKFIIKSDQTNLSQAFPCFSLEIHEFFSDKTPLKTYVQHWNNKRYRCESLMSFFNSKSTY